MKFAVVFDNAVREVREYPEQPVCKLVDGKPVLRPLVEPVLAEGQKYHGFLIEDAQVTRVVVSKTPEEIAADVAAKIEKIEAKTTKLFFKLYKALLAANVLQATDPKLTAVQEAYVEWKALTGN